MVAVLQKEWLLNKFGSGPWSIKLISRLSLRKRSEGLVRVCRRLLKQHTELPTFYFYNAILSLKPLIGLRWKLKKNSRKKKLRQYYQLPFPINNQRSSRLAIQWFMFAMWQGTDSFFSFEKRLFIELSKVTDDFSAFAGCSFKADHYKNIFKNRAAVRFK